MVQPQVPSVQSADLQVPLPVAGSSGCTPALSKRSLGQAFDDCGHISEWAVTWTSHYFHGEDEVLIYSGVGGFVSTTIQIAHKFTRLHQNYMLDNLPPLTQQNYLNLITFFSPSQQSRRQVQFG